MSATMGAASRRSRWLPGDKTSCSIGDSLKREQRFDLVVANVLGAALLDLAPALVRALDNGGTLLLSGIRESERAEITRVFVRMGLRHRLDFDRDGWCAVELATSW